MDGQENRFTDSEEPVPGDLLPREDEKGNERLSARVVHRPLQLVSLGFTFLVFGLPIYSKELGADALTIGGLYTVFTATTLIVRPIVGWALDRYGRKRFFVAALVGYAAAMAAFGIADSIPELYLARFLQGFASALMWISINTIAMDLAASGERGRALGQIQEVSTRAQLIGVFFGFGLMSFLSPERAWIYVFLGYSVLALAGAWFASRQVPETYVPIRQEAPAKPLKISPALFRLMVIVFTTGASAAMIAPIYLIYLQDRFTTDIGVLAWAFFPGGLVYALLPSYFGKLSDRFGRAPLMAAGLVVVGFFSILLPIVPGLGWLAVVYALTSVGWSMADPAEVAMVADITGSLERGAGYGLYDFAGTLGASLGPLVGGWLYDSVGKEIPFYANGILLLTSAAWVAIFLRQKWVQLSAI